MNHHEGHEIPAGRHFIALIRASIANAMCFAGGIGLFHA